MRRPSPSAPVPALLFLALLLALPLLLVAAARPADAARIEKVVSPGGITAWLVHEPSVPVISIEFAFEGGSTADPTKLPGLANMVSGLLDEGAGDLDSQAFQAKLADLAIDLSFDAGRDTFGGSMRTLARNRDEAFRLLRLALTAPRFDGEPVERIRRQILVSLKEHAKDPNSIASRRWFAMAFPGHPYGRPKEGTPDSVNKIKADDLAGYVHRVFARDNLTIGVVGDIDAKELGTLLDRTFGKLPAKAELPALKQESPKAASRLEVVQQDIPQSQVVFGAAGIPRDDPDWYAAYVLNYVLGGGGLTSRLADEVREKRGLAYGVYSYLYPLDHAALWMGGVGTRNDSVAEAIKVIRSTMKRVRDEGVTADELADAKTYLNGSFPLHMTSSGKIASLLVTIQRDHLGIDYLDRRPKLIDAVTREDVARVAKRLLHPGQMLIVVVGKPKGLG